MALALKVSKVETIAGNFFVEPHVITAQEAQDKQIQLIHSPSKPDEVKVEIISGSPQWAGVDFIVNNNIVDWNGYGMETIVAEGDRIRVTYIL